ncbi:hypothetical protein [Prauserella muralis]|uniref:Uncharacterized protein n=1 Tax=Prauserella muralis TaxID=588067 RepID=A0A2V4BC11_9PSEU|nr:hypothetical protein [Prauserella muralis]PXY32591.1 hypothetical protein BAY60_10155 [Prauserella muralis]TWE23692.1 hypothetical protein FHX69_4986 [Prauserella muralis]
MGASQREPRDLAGLVGGPLPESIENLPDEHKRVLAEALREARRRQARALSEASEKSLSHVPFLLRGAVRKAAGL